MDTVNRRAYEGRRILGSTGHCAGDGTGHRDLLGGAVIATPEGKVKAKLTKLLKAHDVYYFFPATGGYGRSGVPDVVGCVHGCFFAIEVKAEGKAGNTTALQEREMEIIRKAGGVAFVYDGTMSNEEVLQRIMGGHV